MASVNGKEATPEQDQKGKLNVILHGLFSFHQEEKEIVAHIPDLGAEHLYKAGTWLAETNLEEHADLKLDGVTPTKLKQFLDARHNIDLGNAPISSNATECHCIHATLRFPYPPYPIRSLRRIKIPAVALGGDDKDRVVNNRDAGVESATVQVLTYDFDDDNKLKLGDHPWEPVPVLLLNEEEQLVTYVNLHVFSEPERNPTDDHIRHAFQAGIGLFVGADLVLKGRMRAPDPDDKIPGVNEFELQDLVQRQRWLALLGRAIKEDRDPRTIWDDPTPFVGSDACTGAFYSGTRR